MNVAELMRTLGRIEGKLEEMHGELAAITRGVEANAGDIRSLQAFRSRVRGAGIMLGAIATVLGIAVEMH